MAKKAALLIVGSAAFLVLIFFSRQNFSHASAQGDDNLKEITLTHLKALMAEKQARTPAQRKIDSELLAELKIRQGQPVAAGIRFIQTGVQLDAAGRTTVDVDALVSERLKKIIASVGGQVKDEFPQYQFLRVVFPLTQIETLAALDEVRFIRRPVKAKTASYPVANRQFEPILPERKETGFAMRAGRVSAWIGNVTSQGDVTHRAAAARMASGVNGTGVKIGVLSDSYNNLSSNAPALNVQAGDLPGAGNPHGYTAPVTVLQDSFELGLRDEGRAMLQIIHDLAPGAQLYFATAWNTPATFAQNIRNLRAAGCDIIIDDVIYFNESPFQDGPIAQAVNEVTDDGALYFSSAGNFGNKNDNTASVWEGDFNDSGVSLLLEGENVGRIHRFGATIFNQAAETSKVDLFWADPLGASANDYDIYVFDPTTTYLLAKSDSSQTGTQDPYETVDCAICGDPANRIYIVKYQGAARFLHVNTSGPAMTISTTGQTRGHACAADAYGVAAVNAATSFPNAFIGGATNPVEWFSSDGPRRVFFQANGTPITPGNFSSSGGALRQKPDIAAADGVSTTVPGFNPFYGTSAAAPHAGAIAALLKSKRLSMTPAEIRSALISSALDIEAPGVDRDSGHGLVMAYQALESVTYVGKLEAANCMQVSGWAASRDQLNTSVNVSIFDAHDNVVDVYTVLADQLRPEIGALLGDNGLHGFTFTFPTPLTGVHSISVKVAGRSNLLTDSPQFVNCLPPLYEGYFDQATCDTISGWATDRNKPSTPINVSIFDGTTLIATVNANQFRADVGAHLGDNGMHGFSLPTPAILKDGLPHSVNVRFESTAVNLGYSPKSLTCATTANYEGYVDRADCSFISGWIADRNRLNTPISVSVYEGTTLVATVVANLSRPDVGAYLGDNGLHGYRIPTPASLADGASHTISLRFENSAVSLGNSPRTFACNYTGYLDRADCSFISGWVADRNRLNNIITASLYDGATFLATVPADQLRSDVGAFLGDNGLHGFSLVTPASLKDSLPHQLNVRFENSNIALGNTPRVINCPPPNYEGYIDVLNCNVIQGWAGDRNRPNASLTISVYDGATLLTTVVANQLRPDVGAHLGDNGLHGFSFATPGALKNGGIHVISLKFETSSTHLSHSPQNLSCNAIANRRH